MTREKEKQQDRNRKAERQMKHANNNVYQDFQINQAIRAQADANIQYGFHAQAVVRANEVRQ